jgi:4-hydroxybenzoate polyprenyltransferase
MMTRKIVVQYSNFLKTPFIFSSRKLRSEFDVTIRLLRSNAIGFLFIFVGGLLARVISTPLTIVETIPLAIKTIVVGLLSSYVFDIANQTSSPQEDYINKPHRPIPAGLISLSQAKARWLLAWTIGPILMYRLFGVWALLHLLHWELLICVCYVWPRWFSWFMRNYFAAFGYFILGRLLNQVLAKAAQMWDVSFLIDLTMGVWFMGTLHIQEFHDLEGDRMSDRKTLPMLLSPPALKSLRVGTSIFVFLFSSSLSFTGYRWMARHCLITPACVLQQLLSCILAYRIWTSKSPYGDKITYHAYYYPTALTILLCLVLITA